MNIAVIIPAAGRGTRFGPTDKLAQDLGGRPLLMRTVEAFGKRDEIQSIIVAGPPDEFDQFRERFGPTLGFHGATLVPGGKSERWETVKRALEHLPDQCTHVAVHDAARPAVTGELIARIIDAAAIHPAIVPGLPLTDTIKRVSDDVHTASPDEDDPADAILGDVGRPTVSTRAVIETVDRANLVAIQTPQLFDVDLLRRAYQQDDLSGATDDASLVERLGESVHVVEGDIRNFKVTTPCDLTLVRAIMGVKPPAARPAHKQF